MTLLSNNMNVTVGRLFMRTPRQTAKRLASLLGQAESAIDEQIDADPSEEDETQDISAKIPTLTDKQWEKIRSLYIFDWDTVERVTTDEGDFATLKYTPKND